MRGIGNNFTRDIGFNDMLVHAFMCRQYMNRTSCYRSFAYMCVCAHILLYLNL